MKYSRNAVVNVAVVACWGANLMLGVVNQSAHQGWTPPWIAFTAISGFTASYLYCDIARDILDADVQRRIDAACEEESE